MLFLLTLTLLLSQSTALSPWMVASTDLTQFPPINYTTAGQKVKNFLNYSAGAKDNEHIHALIHDFSNSFNGIAMEMGAVDGRTHSATSIFSEYFGWKRILVEGSPQHRSKLTNYPNAFAANAAVCGQEQTVHYATFPFFISGILEFMAADFLKQFHRKVYDACTPPGNISSLQFTDEFMKANNIEAVACVPLSKILAETGVKHINFFVLDVEGAELSVLPTIDWEHTTFDILSIEVEEHGFRHKGFGDDVTKFMEERGYAFHGTLGRNNWYKRHGFNSAHEQPGDIGKQPIVLLNW